MLNKPVLNRSRGDHPPARTHDENELPAVGASKGGEPPISMFQIASIISNFGFNSKEHIEAAALLAKQRTEGTRRFWK